LTPQAYGDGKYLASKDDMRTHASEREATDELPEGEEENSLHMWSEEEELFAEYSNASGGGTWKWLLLLLGAVGAVIAVATGVVGDSKSSGLPMYRSAHAHLV